MLKNFHFYSLTISFTTNIAAQSEENRLKTCLFYLTAVQPKNNKSNYFNSSYRNSQERSLSSLKSLTLTQSSGLLRRFLAA